MYESFCPQGHAKLWLVVTRGDMKCPGGSGRGCSVARKWVPRGTSVPVPLLLLPLVVSVFFPSMVLSKRAMVRVLETSCKIRLRPIVHFVRGTLVYCPPGSAKTAIRCMMNA